ncbi:hypothetical protein DLJ88_10825 [Evtepia gabavorous]|uniref:Uncharacterized protein n=4 Tax=Evtepia gabavorous TaxID=2211183 RepID=A0A3E2B1D8_9FIRM|nr:hypothetical protein DV520_10825 [Evtepia gabavorous]TYK62028.1 hypothetical protein DLJ88_10825 [Evtepia gabavorous]
MTMTDSITATQSTRLRTFFWRLGRFYKEIFDNFPQISQCLPTLAHKKKQVGMSVEERHSDL